MPQRFYVVMFLLMERFAARRDAKIRFLKAEVRILRKKLKGNRVIVDPKDRFYLLRLGSELDHQVKDIIGIVSYQTYQRWVREQRDGKKVGAVGRPRMRKEIRELVVRIARENVQWGYRRIVGELRKLNLSISKSTISRVLKEEGIHPEPGKGQTRPGDSTWRKFIRLHMNTLVACDFFTKAIVTPLGIRTAYCLFFIHLGSRKVFLAPATYHANSSWMRRQAQNVASWCEEQGIHVDYLIHDRDRKFAKSFDALFDGRDVRVIRTPVQAPNANAFAESWVATVKRECLDYFVCFSRGHLDHIAQQFTQFYNQHRPHQGVGNRPLSVAARTGLDAQSTVSIRCHHRLGGLLKAYYRQAA